MTIGINLYLHSYNKTNFSKNLNPSENEETISDIDFPVLPENISEINQKQESSIDTAQTIETVKNEPLKESSIPAKSTLKENVKPLVKTLKEPIAKTLVIEREPKQPSVKIETFVKSEGQQKAKAKVKKSETNSAQFIKVKSEMVKPVKTKEKRIVEKKLADNKTTVKTPLKSLPRTITSEEVVYQAGQLMETNQGAAIQLLKEKIKLVSPDADYYSLMANLQQRRKEYDEAIISYRKALEIAPDKGELWIGIALAYRGTGEEANAKKAFKQALTSIEISRELKRYAQKQL